MRRAWAIGSLSLVGLAMAAGCSVSATGTGLSPEFALVASEAHEYLTTDVIPAGRMPEFPEALAESRAIVKDAEAAIVNDADRGVWLILNLVNAKAHETRRIYELEERIRQHSPATAAALRGAISERSQCMTELEGWLSSDVSKVPSLQRGACLQSARQAAAALSR